MGIAIRVARLHRKDRIIRSVLPVEADLVHVDVNSFFHLFPLMDADSAALDKGEPQAESAWVGIPLTP